MNPFASPLLYGPPPPTPSGTPQTPSGKRTRPPIHNPYDKLTKPQFDTWVDDMTDALRRALGHDVAESEAETPVATEGEVDEEEVEDTFTEVNARRSKGKARDPREGPGLGARDLPIDLFSDTDEDGDEDDEEWIRQEVDRFLGSDSSGEDDDLDAFHRDDDVEENNEEWIRQEVDRFLGSDSSGEDDDLDAFHRDDDVEENGPVEVEKAIEISSGEEGDNDVVDDDDERSDDDEGHRIVTDIFDPPHTDMGEYDYDGEDEEDELQGGHQYVSSQRADISDSLTGARTSTEDIYSAGDAQNGGFHKRSVSPSHSEDIIESDCNYDDEGNSEDDDAEVFPPFGQDSQLSVQPIDLPNPWEGPQTYAEDFYSGGDAFDPTNATPSHLTPRDDTRGFLTPSSSHLTPSGHGHLTPQHPEAIIDVDQDDDELPNSSPILSSPVEETGPFSKRNDSLIDHHSNVTGPSSAGVHVAGDKTSKDDFVDREIEWDHTKINPGPGHLRKEDDEEDEHQLELEEGEEEEDEEEEDEEEAEGPTLLGTSDLLGDTDEICGESGEEATAVTEGFLNDSGPLLTSTSVVKEYTVMEVDVDTEGEMDDLDEIVTVAGEKTGDTSYTVEEPMTEGRLTEEAPEREPSIATDFSPVGDEQPHPENSLPLLPDPNSETITQGDVAPTESLAFGAVQQSPLRKTDRAVEPEIVHEPDDQKRYSAIIPMPVSADPNVPDPTSLPRTPPFRSPTPARLISISEPLPVSILKVLQMQQANTSGLFTPPNEESAQINTEARTMTARTETSPDRELPSATHLDENVAEHVAKSSKHTGTAEEALLPDDDMDVGPSSFHESTSDASVPFLMGTELEDHIPDQDLELATFSPLLTLRQDAGDADTLPDKPSTEDGTELGYPSESEGRTAGDAGSNPHRDNSLQPGRDTSATTSGLHHSNTRSESFSILNPVGDDVMATAGVVKDESILEVERQPGVDTENIGTNATQESGHWEVSPAGNQSDTFKLDSTIAPDTSEGELGHSKVIDTLPIEEQEGVPATMSADEPASLGEVLSQDVPPPDAAVEQGDHTASTEPTQDNGDNSAIAQDLILGIEARPMSSQDREKGKVAINHEDSDNSDAQSFSSASPSITERMLLPGSQATSRAASVVSSGASNDSSSVALASPAEKQPFIHTHGALRRPQGADRPSSYATHQQIVKVPLPLPGTPTKATTPRTRSPRPGSSQRQITAASLANPRTGGSPITRSHCRFHKISLPQEDEGTRAFFLVPGCSLTDKKLMSEEDIQDHGDATVSDSKRMIDDIESLDFSGDLIGTLRHLVGVDLLREHEVFYLPPWKKLPRNSVPSSHLRDLPVTDYGSANGSPRVANGSMRSLMVTSSQAPISTAVSMPSGSRKRTITSSKVDSPTLPHSDDGDRESDESKSKRRKHKQTSPAFDIVCSANKIILKPRRSRRLGPDAAEYKPDRDTDGDSPDEKLLAPKSRPKKARKRGLKRTRTDPEEENGQKSKKLRKHQTST